MLLPFRFEAKMMAVFCFRFASFHFEAKMMEVFRFRFASFRFKAKMMAVFHFFCFVFSSLHFRFTSNFYVSHQCETCEKSFRFASFRFEAKMTAHPNRQLFLYCLGTYTFFQFKGMPSFKVDKTGFSM
jgi:hypothetical protein